jgi:uroporphyrin-III C-methyltransferase / precorrin-2 dehydrogenase / sirohydrochlorin ferrochelatase
VAGARLVYGANDEAVEDARVAALAEAAGVLHNIVDNLEGSAFLTPAMVDRDPLVVAIGTEGAAPCSPARSRRISRRSCPRRSARS